MANYVTKWILEFGDKVTAPIKNMMKGVSGVTKSVDRMSKRVKYSEKEAGEALKNTKSHYDSLKGKIKENELELKKLEKAFEDAAPGRNKVAALEALEQQRAKVKQLNVQLQETEEDLKDINEQLDGFKKRETNWTMLATGANQLSEIIGKVVDSMDFSVVYRNLRVEIQRMTDLTDEALDKATKKSKAIADGYDQDANLIARAANAMTEQIGGSFDGNLDLLEEGLKRGANINGDFLDSMREYAPFIRQTGMSASQAIALITQANKKGIYSDKAIDAIKEATMSLKEMDQAQIDALKGVGLKPEDLVGKTGIEAIQLVSSKMQGQTAQVKQKILADIFKGAGEDAGLMFVEELSTMEFDIEKIPAVEQAGSGFRMWLSNLKSTMAGYMGDFGVYAKELSPFFQILAGGIPLIQALTKATWLQTVAQKALNIVMSLNPVGIIIVGIILLIGLVYKAIKSFDTWGSTILLLMGPIGMLISGILLIKRHWDSIVEAFKADGMIGALKRIGIVLLDVIMHPLERILGWVAELTGWDWAKSAANSVNEFRAKNDLITADERTPILDPDKPKPVGGINDLIKPETLSFSNTGDDKGKGKGKGKNGDGLNVGSGTGGIKSITMNLDVTNNFSVSKDSNIRDIAEKVTGMINDRLRDAVINLG